MPEIIRMVDAVARQIPEFFIGKVFLPISSDIDEGDSGICLCQRVKLPGKSPCRGPVQPPGKILNGKAVTINARKHFIHLMPLQIDPVASRNQL